MIYTGVGSRAVPMEFLLPIKEIAFWAAKNNWTLRSGGADGCDSAFETFHHGEKEIFLPWKGFNKNRSELFPPPADAYVIAETIHPNWWGCSKFSKDFHARNIQQVLGRDLDSPTDCVVCWTPEGATVGGNRNSNPLCYAARHSSVQFGSSLFQRDHHENEGLTRCQACLRFQLCRHQNSTL